ncbi:MAG TPA: hypothetical protein VGJ91_03135 [Polyangiaceae bacterium]
MMVGNDRSSGSRRRWQPTLITSIIALAAQACNTFDSSEPPRVIVPSGSNGGAVPVTPTPPVRFGGSGGSAGTNFGTPLNPLNPGDPGGAPNTNGCAQDSLLADQVVLGIGAQRVFYSWTTDEQVAELRAGGPLFSRSESPGQGRGLAMTQLAAFGAAGTEPVNQLAATLASTVFAKLRFSWTNPWATLMGWPGESYGNQLLQVTLRPEAWIAVYNQRHGFRVYDSSGLLVEIGVASASPERIGAIYFQSAADSSSTYCGSFSQGAVAFREFVLGNLQMVQSWSLATPEITARLNADMAALQAFSAELSCLPSLSVWSADAVCAPSDEIPYQLAGSMLNYDLALAIPSELYWPSQDNIAAILAALQVSLPQGEPLVVNPGG